MTSLRTARRTLLDKLWDAHVISPGAAGAPDLLYVDLHFVNEVTSPQAFDGLRAAGRGVRRPDLTLATEDHNVPTAGSSSGLFASASPLARAQLEALRANCAAFGIPLRRLGERDQGIVHVIAPETGLTQPGMLIACGDSHTATHGAYGALGVGIGTSEVEQVLATQTWWQPRPRAIAVEVDGALAPGVTAKVSRAGDRRPSRPAWRRRRRVRVPRRGRNRARHGRPADAVQPKHRGRRASWLDRT